MDNNTLSNLQNTADALFRIYKKDQEEGIYADKYLAEDSILNSGWDYHWVSVNVAGCVSQLKNNGKIEDFGCLLHLGTFKFMSADILEVYFPDSEKCPIFIANLWLQQQVLDICLNHIKSST